jgi:hypothetical protein
MHRRSVRIDAAAMRCASGGKRSARVDAPAVGVEIMLRDMGAHRCLGASARIGTA